MEKCTGLEFKELEQWHDYKPDSDVSLITAESEAYHAAGNSYNEDTGYAQYAVSPVPGSMARKLRTMPSDADDTHEAGSCSVSDRRWFSV